MSLNSYNEVYLFCLLHVVNDNWRWQEKLINKLIQINTNHYGSFLNPF